MGSGKSFAIAISFRPTSFQLSSSSCEGPTAGLGGASFFIVPCPAASAPRIPTTRTTFANCFFISPIPPLISLLQSSLPQHFQELFLGTHIDRLRYQLSIPIVDETLRNPFHHKRVVYLPTWIKQYR